MKLCTYTGSHNHTSNDTESFYDDDRSEQREEKKGRKRQKTNTKRDPQVEEKELVGPGFKPDSQVVLHQSRPLQMHQFIQPQCAFQQQYAAPVLFHFDPTYPQQVSYFQQQFQAFPGQEFPFAVGPDQRFLFLEDHNARLILGSKR